MAEQKNDNFPIQYPQKRAKAPSNKPQPINNKLPKIAIPNETELALNDSDWAMFDKIKKKYGSKLDVFYCDDILRFVQGYSHEKEREKETYKRIDELLKRGFSGIDSEWNFETILDSPMPHNEEKESLKAWPVFMYGYDDQGHPVMYDEIGSSNPTDLDKTFDGKLRKLRTFRFRALRRLHNTKRIQNKRYGFDGSVNAKGGVNGITKHCIVMDISNFHAKALTAKYRNLVRDIIGDESNLWPNTLEKMYIINAPWPFRFAWKIIQNFIHPITVAKIEILGADYIKTMKKKISMDQIPKSYGGTNELPIKLGYTADIDNDLLDGDYCKQSDPINYDTISCKKNKTNKQKSNDDDKKEKEKEKEITTNNNSGGSGS
eukprot:209682_1